MFVVSEVVFLQVHLVHNKEVLNAGHVVDVPVLGKDHGNRFKFVDLVLLRVFLSANCVVVFVLFVIEHFIILLIF